MVRFLGKFRFAILFGAIFWPITSLHNTAIGASNLPSNTPASVEVPCTLDGATDRGFLRRCNEVLTEFKRDLDERIKNQAVNLYQGKSINPAAGTYYRFEQPVCNVTANTFNDSKAEETTNHIGQSCGQPVRASVTVPLRFRIRRGVPTCRKAGANSGTLDGHSPYGVRERAYFGGAYLQALSCYLEQVKQEVDSHELKITPAGGCESLAADVANLGRNSKKVADQITDNLKTQKNIDDIWHCIDQWDPSSNPSPDIGPIRQSAHYMCGARKGIESSFNHLMACEVFARAQKDFQATLVDIDTFGSRLRGGSGSIGDACVSECNSYCRGHVNSCSTGAASDCGTKCGNTCYERELKEYIKRIQTRWPNDGKCPALTSSLTSTTMERSLC